MQPKVLNEPRPGDLIAGKYRIVTKIGAGGMGTVFAADHLALRRKVAIKILNPTALQLPCAVARFMREGRTAGAIQSEHVARILDLGTLENHTPYIVMEHLTGTDLSKIIRKACPMPIADAVDFVLQVSEALAEAHSLGIVHRDLKPANIFVTRRPDGSPLVKVLDFGLSKVDDAQNVALTATNIVAGSPHYMSPEQLRSLKNVDARADVWSLGVILYELLTGKRPFSGITSSAVLASVAADLPISAKTLQPEIPADLDRVILRCLEKDRTKRIQNITDLARGLMPHAPARSSQSLDRIAGLPGHAVIEATPAPEPTADAPTPKTVSRLSLANTTDEPSVILKAPPVGLSALESEPPTEPSIVPTATCPSIVEAAKNTEPRSITDAPTSDRRTSSFPLGAWWHTASERRPGSRMAAFAGLSAILFLLLLLGWGVFHPAPDGVATPPPRVAGEHSDPVGLADSGGLARTPSATPSSRPLASAPATSSAPKGTSAPGPSTSASAPRTQGAPVIRRLQPRTQRPLPSAPPQTEADVPLP